MKKLNIRNSFKNNKFKYGSLSILVTIIVIVVFIIGNLLVDQLNVSADMTKTKIYSLTDKSVKLVKNLKKEITIIGLYESGKEDKDVAELLKKYKSASSKINVEYKDPVANPQLLTKYSSSGKTISTNSVVVECGNKYKVIDSSEMTSTSQSSDGESSTEYINREQKISGAIMYVTSDKNSTIYELTGHGETSPETDLQSQFSNQNYTTKELNLLKATEWNPVNGDLLLVYNPQSDISSKEKDTIKNFLAKGGKALFIMNYADKQNIPNLDEVLETYGVQIQKSIIYEPDQSYRYGSYLDGLIPEIKSHDITNDLISAKTPVLIPGAEPIMETKIKKSSITVTPLLTTSSQSWAKKDMKSESTEKTTQDYPGPFNVAVAVTDKIDSSNDDNNTRIVVMSSADTLNSQVITTSNGANTTLFINSLNWLQNKKDNLVISAKSLSDYTITINALQKNLVSVISIFIIPAAVLVAGLVVWLRRKNL